MLVGNIEVYGVIYIIKNVANNKVYIGQTTQGFDNRYRARGNSDIQRVFNYLTYSKNGGRYYNKHLYGSILKHGTKNFTVNKVFDIAFSEDELNIKEETWISIYNSTNKELGFNLALGGKPSRLTPDTKKLISLHHAAISGEDHYATKISSELASTIKERLASKDTCKNISECYNIPYTLVANIKSLKSWKNLRPELNDSILKNKSLFFRNEDIYYDICILKFRENKRNKDIMTILGVSRSKVDRAIRWSKENFKKEMN